MKETKEILGVYETPEVKVVNLLSEGVLCSSVNSIQNEDFGDGGYYEL